MVDINPNLLLRYATFKNARSNLSLNLNNHSEANLNAYQILNSNLNMIIILSKERQNINVPPTSMILLYNQKIVKLKISNLIKLWFMYRKHSS